MTFCTRGTAGAADGRGGLYRCPRRLRPLELPRHELRGPERRSPILGFTLAEILVSILIFSVVSLAMVTILFTSTNVFRAGEHGRASTDEALAALGALDDDLKRIVPARDGGFFYAALCSYDAKTYAPLPNNGNCAVAFTISAPPGVLDASGKRGRLLAMYWVEIDGQGTADQEDVLYRAVTPVAADVDPAKKDVDLVKAELFPTTTAPRPYPPTIIARRCLHFGAWVSNIPKQRKSPADWTNDIADEAIAPTVGGADYCTDSVGGVAADPFPVAIRFTLSISAGRYAQSGLVIEDDEANNRIRIAGVPALSTAPGSMVRIDDEWIAYSDYRNGAIIWEAGMRGARRTSQTHHDRGKRVLAGQSYSLARAFPH